MKPKPSKPKRAKAVVKTSDATQLEPKPEPKAEKSSKCRAKEIGHLACADAGCPICIDLASR